jgi:hypothetical protein
MCQPTNESLIMQTWLRKLKNKYHWSNKITVSQSSTFVCNADLVKSRVSVNGNNTVSIGSQTKLIKVELSVAGENNQLIIGNDCYIENDAPAKAAAFED